MARWVAVQVDRLAGASGAQATVLRFAGPEVLAHRL